MNASRLAIATPGESLPTVARHHARLVALMGDSPGKIFPLDDELVIGRDPKCSVWTPQLDVSRRHARIFIDDSENFFIEDLGSKNGTLVNGKTVLRKNLHFGDRVQIGASANFVFSQNDQLHEQMLQSQKMEAMGRLAASVVHDFGNLLTSLLGHVELIENRPSVVADTEVSSSVSAVKTAAQQGTQLIQQLLRFAQDRKSKPESIAIADVIQQATHILAASLQGKIRVQLELSPDLLVVGDRSQIHQLVMNLLTNARDAMPNGGTLTITTTHVRLHHANLTTLPAISAGAYVVLCVEDTGCGMDLDAQQRIFEPFYTTKSADRGTGLGLAACYGIVRSHGGGIDVLSTPDVGTSFRVYLPLPQAKPGRRSGT